MFARLGRCVYRRSAEIIIIAGALVLTTGDDPPRRGTGRLNRMTPPAWNRMSPNSTCGHLVCTTIASCRSPGCRTKCCSSNSPAGDGGGHFTLAPAYDTVPTMLWPKLRATTAMSINNKVDIDSINIDDLTIEAAAWGLRRERACEVALDLAEVVHKNARSVVDHDELAAKIIDRSQRIAACVP